MANYVFSSVRQGRLTVAAGLWVGLLLAMVGVEGLAQCQGQYDVLRGRVVCGSRPVSYASLSLMGSSVGTACNDVGEYELKVPAGHEEDTVVVSSVGYVQAKLVVGQLRKNGTVKLRNQAIALREVTVSSYRTPQLLLGAAVKHIDSNYHQHKAYSTYFLREWRAVDGELFLFDEAVMQVMRYGYSQYANKRGYRFDVSQREMATNYKHLLRHRLVVYDYDLLNTKLHNPEGVDQMMEYSDNEEFYDPVATPQASFALSRRTLAQHRFEPIQEFVDNGEVYYRLRSVGPGRIGNSKVNYTYIVRKSNLAIVSITAVQHPLQTQAGTESWVNMEYNRMKIIEDSSLWTYSMHEGAYTLTRYYNVSTVEYGTGSRWEFQPKQRWQQCVDWTLTDFSSEAASEEGEIIDVRPQSVSGAFGPSDYSNDFWGNYNSVLIDSLPLQLLRQKADTIASRRR